MAIERDPVLTMSGDGRVEMHHEAELWLRMAREFFEFSDCIADVSKRRGLRCAGDIALQRACESVIGDATRASMAYIGSPLDALSFAHDSLRAQVLQSGVQSGDPRYDVEVRVTWRPVSTGKVGG